MLGQFVSHSHCKDAPTRRPSLANGLRRIGIVRNQVPHQLPPQLLLLNGQNPRARHVRAGRGQRRGGDALGDCWIIGGRVECRVVMLEYP